MAVNRPKDYAEGTVQLRHNNERRCRHQKASRCRGAVFEKSGCVIHDQGDVSDPGRGLLGRVRKREPDSGGRVSAGQLAKRQLWWRAYPWTKVPEEHEA